MTIKAAAIARLGKWTQWFNSVYIYQESLRQAQRRLIQAGFNPGKADGLFGETTAAALKQFQTQNKLPVTGLPDQPTLHLLMRTQQ